MSADMGDLTNRNPNASFTPDEVEPRERGHYEGQVAQNAFDVGEKIGRELDSAYEAGYEIEQLIVSVSYRKAPFEVIAWKPLHGERTTSSVGLIEYVLRKLRASLD